MSVRVAEEHFERGIHYFRGGFFPAALQEFRAVARVDPDYQNIQHFISVTQKKTDEISGQLVNFIEESFDNQTLQLSEELVVSGTPNFGKEIERLLRREEYQAALEKLRTVESFVAESRPFILLNANVYRRLGRFHEAEQALIRAQTMFPRDAEIINNLGNIYLARNQFSAARQQFDMALKLAPDDRRILNNLGALLMQTHNLDGAQSLFERLVREHPAWRVCRNNLENLIRRKTELDREISGLRQELFLHPEYLDVALNLGKSLFFRGYFTESQQILGEVLQKNPNLLAAYFYLGSLHELLGKMPQAIDFYQQMVVRKEKNTTTEFQNFHNFLQEGYQDEALAELKKLAVIDLDLAAGHIAIGIRYFEEGHWNEALSHFTEASQLNSRYPDAYYWRGLTRLRTSEKTGAEKDFRKAIELHPDFADAHFQLGMLLREKMPKKAHYYLENAVKLGVRSQFAAIAQEFLSPAKVKRSK